MSKQSNKVVEVAAIIRKGYENNIAFVHIAQSVLDMLDNKNKVYEILEFSSTIKPFPLRNLFLKQNGNYHWKEVEGIDRFTGVSLDDILNVAESSVRSGHWRIESIRLVEKGEVFKLGDKVIWDWFSPYSKVPETIKSFWIDNNGLFRVNESTLEGIIKLNLRHYMPRTIRQIDVELTDEEYDKLKKADEEISKLARIYALKNVFEINEGLFSNNNDEAGNAVKCSIESFIAGYEACLQKYGLSPGI